MKAALILKGGPAVPDGGKLKRHGITRCYYEANDPQISEQFFNDLRSWGFEAAIMRDPVWSNYNDTPQQFVAKVSADINRLTPLRAGKRAPLAVMLDIERHDEAYVFDALSEFKRVWPGKNVAWTLEYHQGGWFSQRLVELINGYSQCRVLPQLYYGDMSNVVDSHAAARDLAQPHGGVNDDRVGFFYSLRAPIPVDWDGVLYLENWTLLP